MGVMNRFMNFLGLQEEEENMERERLAGEVENEHPANELRKKNNVVSIHSQKTTRVVLGEPRSYEEAQALADELRSRRPVVVNLQRVRADQAIRIVDFLSGTVYALNGSICKIGSNIFICTPENVEIHGAITEMLEQEADYNK